METGQIKDELPAYSSAINEQRNACVSWPGEAGCITGPFDISSRRHAKSSLRSRRARDAHPPTPILAARASSQGMLTRASRT